MIDFIARHFRLITPSLGDSFQWQLKQVEPKPVAAPAMAVDMVVARVPGGNDPSLYQGLIHLVLRRITSMGNNNRHGNPGSGTKGTGGGGPAPTRPGGGGK
jgi:hypothetical protein